MRRWCPGRQGQDSEANGRSQDSGSRNGRSQDGRSQTKEQKWQDQNGRTRIRTAGTRIVTTG